MAKQNPIILCLSVTLKTRPAPHKRHSGKPSARAKILILRRSEPAERRAISRGVQRSERDAIFASRECDDATGEIEESPNLDEDDDED